VFWIVSGPIVILSLALFFTFPQFLTAAIQRTQIPSIGLSPDMRLELSVRPSVEDLARDYFTSQLTMNLYIEENSTKRTSYNVIVIPMGFESAVYGVGVPFENLQHEYPSYTLDRLTGEWTTYHKYSHSQDFRMPIASEFPERFPRDCYLSSTIYVWFSGSFYPKINLSPTSSVPRGFILALTEPRLVNATHFYLDLLPPAHRLAVAMPKNDVLAFEVEIQRDLQSLFLYLVYIVFLLCLVFEILAISHLKIKETPDRLKIFASLAIASVAFLWSTRQVAHAMTWSEILLESILVFWLTFEVKDALGSQLMAS